MHQALSASPLRCLLVWWTLQLELHVLWVFSAYSRGTRLLASLDFEYCTRRAKLKYSKVSREFFPSIQRYLTSFARVLKDEMCTIVNYSMSGTVWLTQPQLHTVTTYLTQHGSYRTVEPFDPPIQHTIMIVIVPVYYATYSGSKQTSLLFVWTK